MNFGDKVVNCKNQLKHIRTMSKHFIFISLLFSSICFGQTKREFCQSPQFYSSNCYTYVKESERSKTGIFTYKFFYDIGQNFSATRTFTETKEKIILEPYKLVRSEYNGIEKSITKDTTFITRNTEFYKKRNNLICYDQNDKKWKEKK